MATVFMKWLETTPGDYDRGIQLLTLGRLRALKERIATNYVRPGGCKSALTGTNAPACGSASKSAPSAAGPLAQKREKPSFTMETAASPAARACFSARKGRLN